MEIEKKFTIKRLPDQLETFEKLEMEQGYLCSRPVVRIRKSNEDYILTYKSKLGIEERIQNTACVNNEIEAALTREGYEHLKGKIDHHLVCKTRYLIPISGGLTVELDVFHGRLEGLVFAEVEFKTLKDAENFCLPDWFLADVSFEPMYKNNYLATLDSWEK